VPKPEVVEEKLERIIPAEWIPRAFRWLVLHGRYVCTARKAECERCIICDLCRWEEKGACPEPPFK
jgi:endonuclease-3